MEDLTHVRFTNLDKMMYPELKLSKKDVIEYYIRCVSISGMCPVLGV